MEEQPVSEEEKPKGVKKMRKEQKKGKKRMITDGMDTISSVEFAIDVIASLEEMYEYLDDEDDHLYAEAPIPEDLRREGRAEEIDFVSKMKAVSRVKKAEVLAKGFKPTPTIWVEADCARRISSEEERSGTMSSLRLPPLRARGS